MQAPSVARAAGAISHSPLVPIPARGPLTVDGFVFKNPPGKVNPTGVQDWIGRLNLSSYWGWVPIRAGTVPVRQPRALESGSDEAGQPQLRAYALGVFSHQVIQ